MHKAISSLLSVLALAVAFHGSHAAVFIHPDTKDCSMSGSSLKCDFNYGEDTVFLDVLPDEGGVRNAITVIYIYNVRKVIITRPMCVDASFYNVQVVHFSSYNACAKRMVMLRLFDSTANQVPRQLSRLEVIRSKIGVVNCNLGLQKLVVSDSEIDEFNAPWPVAGAFTIRIENSFIRKFVALNIENRVILVVTNSTLESMEKESLTLGKGSSAIITRSTVASIVENAIVVKNGAKLTIKDTKGKFSITGAQPGREDEYEKLPPGVPHKVIKPPSDDEEDPELSTKEDAQTICRQDVTWVWFIPTVLATIEGIVIIVQCGKNFPNKRKPSLGPDTENPMGLYGVPASAPMQDSSVTYYTEGNISYKQPILRRR